MNNRGQHSKSRTFRRSENYYGSISFCSLRTMSPIVIDQPEDELDSNFIYHELVPLLRKVKNWRQLILTTHNANLPMNADTDLVFAFNVKEGRGVQLAIGGLDQANSANAVVHIMEGSAEAFKRRFDKYHL